MNGSESTVIDLTENIASIAGTVVKMMLAQKAHELMRVCPDGGYLDWRSHKGGWSIEVAYQKSRARISASHNSSGFVLTTDHRLAGGDLSITRGSSLDDDVFYKELDQYSDFIKREIFGIKE